MAKSVARSDWELDEVVYLRDSGWSFKGIAGFLGVSESAARKLYKRVVSQRSHEGAASSLSEEQDG